MPSQLVPHKSGAHRVAAIALYRALLSQCARAPLAPAVRDDLRNIARNRFRANRFNTSAAQLKVYFAAGYEAVDLLDVAVAGGPGSAKSARYLKKLAERVAPDWMKKAPESPAVRLAKRTKVKGESRLQAIDLDLLPPADLERDVALLGTEQPSEEPLFPDARPGSILARPLPRAMLQGERRVPKLISANWIPILRMGKPQPPALSSYITSRLKVRQERQDRRHRLAAERSLAVAEDQWDAILRTAMSSADKNTKKKKSGQASSRHEPRWAEEVAEALSTVEGALNAEKQKNIRIAAAMQRIVEREQALYDQEREEKRAARELAATQRREEAARVAQQLKELKFEDLRLDAIPAIPDDIVAEIDRTRGTDDHEIDRATFDLLGLGLKERGVLKLVAEPGDKSFSGTLRDQRAAKLGQVTPSQSV